MKLKSNISCCGYLTAKITNLSNLTFQKNVDHKQSVMSEIKLVESVITNPLDVLTVKVFSLRVSDVENTQYAIKITFSDELILETVITSSWIRDVKTENVLAQGSMNYDPSNYEKMCLLADVPLIGK